MAKAQAIAVIGQTVLGLLADNIPKTEFSNARFELYQTANFTAPMEEGISLFLYRVEINAGLRNLPAQTGLDGVSRSSSTASGFCRRSAKFCSFARAETSKFRLFRRRSKRSKRF